MRKITESHFGTIHAERTDGTTDRIYELSEKLQALAPYTARGACFDEEKTEEYYTVLRAFQEAKKEQREKNIVTKKPYRKNTKVVFVNSFGEATKREITTTTYDRQQKRLSSEIMGFIAK